MSAPVRVEVLANDWIPPMVVGRCREVEEVVRRLDAPSPRAPPPWIVGVAGRSGAGSSAVARRAARDVVDRLRAHSAEPTPRAWAVRVGARRGPHGVASALLQLLDEGFDGRGFPTAEILAGFLRRVRRDGRPTVLVLDDLAGSEPDLAPIVRALADPDRFLPEGDHGLPPFWTILAGTPEALAHLDARTRDRVPLAPFVALGPYDAATLTAVVRDRAERALGREPSEELLRRIVDETCRDGGGARRAIDLLRRDLLRPARTGPGARGPWPRPEGVSVETRVVRAIDVASRGRIAPLGVVRRCEADLARAQGQRPLPTTTLWRRIVRLERAGYVRREIRTGGDGGTRSLVRVLTPIEEWVTVPSPRDSPRADGPWTGSIPAAAAEDPWRGPPRPSSWGGARPVGGAD